MDELTRFRKLELTRDWRTGLFRYGFALLAFEALSGTYLFFVKELADADMVLLLAHIALGFPFLISPIMFQLRHRAYSKIWPDRTLSALGAATLAGLHFTFLSGVILTFTGVSAHRILWGSHVAISSLSALLILAYVALALRRIFGLAPTQALPQLRASVRAIVTRVLLLAATLTAICLAVAALLPTFRPEAIVEDYSTPLGTTNPFFPGKARTESGGFVRQELLTGSKSCGTSGCHADTYKQWYDSAHYRTPGPIVSKVRQLLIEEGDAGILFDERGGAHLEEIRKKHPGREAFRLCASCHAPVSLLSGHETPGRSLGTFEQHEGISCVLCHSITKTGKGSGDFEIKPPRNYIFWNSKGALGQFAHETLIRAKPEFHKMTFGKPLYGRSDYCYGCHNRLQYDSWRDSAYNDASLPDKNKECQSCHMEQVAAKDDASAHAKGTVADHRFLSSGIVLPRYYGLDEQFRLTEKYMKDKRILVQLLVPASVRPGATARFAVRIANIGIGHDFPAGPEGDIIEAWPRIVARDASGREILDYGALSKEGHLDEARTRIYRILPRDTNGVPLELDRHRSWRYAQDVLHVIPPKTYDEFVLELDVPADAQGRIRIAADLRYRKPNQRFADWVFGQGKFIVPVVDMASTSAETEVSTDAQTRTRAREAWQATLQNPETSPGLTRRAPEIRYERKVSNTENVIIENAVQALARGEKDRARALLDSLTELTRRRMNVRKLYRRLETGESEPTVRGGAEED